MTRSRRQRNPPSKLKYHDPLDCISRRCRAGCWSLPDARQEAKREVRAMVDAVSDIARDEDS